MVLLSAMDAKIQQGESSSDEMYEEVEEVVVTNCGQNFGHKVNKLRSYRRKFKKLIYNPTKAKLSQCCLPSTIPASLLLATSKPANNLIFHLHISLLWPQGAGPAFLKSLAASQSLLTMFGFKFHHIYLHSALYVCI